MAEKYLGNPKVTARDIYAADATSLLSKNMIDYPTQKYDDAQKQLAPGNPLWWMYTLVQSQMGMELPKWCKTFLIYDSKFFLRNGAVHTESGTSFVNVLTDKDTPAPGDNLVTKRAHYIRMNQEESGKDKIHIRTVVDQHTHDFAERFYDFDNYARMMDHIVTTMARANTLFLSTLITGMFIGMTGGAVMFDEGSDLARFFQPTGKDLVPSEQFSKAAKEYYDNDGEVKKAIKREVGRVYGNLKNKAIYDVIVVREIGPQAQEIKEHKFPDISDQAKVNAWLKGTYTQTVDNAMKTLTITRRESLWSLMEAIQYKLTRMTEINSVYNWMGLDTSRDPAQINSDDVRDFEMRMKPGDALVFMNSEDLNDARAVVGGPHTGYFANVTSNVIGSWEAKGVKFNGVPFMLPGSFLIIPRYALNIVTYFDEMYSETFPMHLIKNHIRHVMMKVVAFRNVPGHFGMMKTFQPNSTWLQKHSYA